MDNFVVRKRRRTETESEKLPAPEDGESTDFKLTLLASLHTDLEMNADTLLEALLSSDGSVEKASALLADQARRGLKRKRFSSTPLDRQGSLADFQIGEPGDVSKAAKLLTKKGVTLHLFHPKDVEEHTPCSIIHNFLPTEEADELLKEILQETPTFERLKFKLFDRVVESPHTMSFYVDTMTEMERQKTEYFYNGRRVHDVRKTLPLMLKTSVRVKAAVNAEVQRRIKERYPGGKKLKYQSPDEWQPNCSFVNCYDGAQESVGYHSDQLTYLGPRAIIGSLSLGVAREFRVRKIVAKDDDTVEKDDTLDESDSNTGETTRPDRGDEQGQIAIHLPHNSLLIMHAEMQEEWKHSISPAKAIDPHPIAGRKRLNVTYRCYKDHLHPEYTPKCKCGIPCVLRCVQRKAGSRGRYMWSCHSHYSPGEKGCTFFQWGEFDDDGRPPWATKN